MPLTINKSIIQNTKVKKNHIQKNVMLNIKVEQELIVLSN